MTLGFTDVLVIAIYAIIVLVTGFVSSKKSGKSDNDFILAGRRLTLPLFVATLVATWYGSVLGVGEFVYSNGVLAWICFGVPYYVVALIYALFYSGKIRSLEFNSIPDQISSSYGKTAGFAASIVMLIITIPASYILMLGIIVQIFADVNIWVAMIIGTTISMIYLFKGGFKSDVYANVAQFLIMYIGFGALLVFAILHFGSPASMTSHLPSQHLSFTGGKNWQYIAGWFLIACQTFIDPSFHQRCAAAKSPKTARNGILVSILFWMLFDSFTLFSGLYAKAFLNLNEPLMAYPKLAEIVLPPVWKGIFVAAMLAAIMSTLDSYAFLSGMTIGNDVLKKFKTFSQISMNKMTKVGLIITGIIGILLAGAIPSVIDLIYRTASIAVPGLIIPMLASMTNGIKLKGKGAVAIIITSSCSSLIWMILQNYGFSFAENIEPMIVGIVISVILSIVLIRRK